MTGYNLPEALLGRGEDFMRRKGEQRRSVRQRGADWHVYFRRLTTDAEGNAVWLQTSRLVGPAQGPQRLTRAQAERKAYDEIVSKANGLTVTPGAAVTVGEFYDARCAVDVLPGSEDLLRRGHDPVFSDLAALAVSHRPAIPTRASLAPLAGVGGRAALRAGSQLGISEAALLADLAALGLRGAEGGKFGAV